MPALRSGKLRIPFFVAFICFFVKFILHLQGSREQCAAPTDCANQNNAIMKRDYLLPRRFKTFGWVVLLPTLFLGAVAIFSGTGTDGLAEFIEKAIGQGRLAPTAEPVRRIGTGIEPWLNNFLIIGIIGGSILVTCSRERVEDEMIGRIRLNALLLALYVHFVVVIVAALCVYGFDFLDVLVYNLYTLPLLFLMIYKGMLWKENRAANDEE